MYTVHAAQRICIHIIIYDAIIYIFMYSESNEIFRSRRLHRPSPTPSCILVSPIAWPLSFYKQYTCTWLLLIIRGYTEFNTLGIERIKSDKHLFCTIPTVIYYTWNVHSNEIMFCIFYGFWVCNNYNYIF